GRRSLRPTEADRCIVLRRTVWKSELIPLTQRQLRRIIALRLRQQLPCAVLVLIGEGLGVAFLELGCLQKETRRSGSRRAAVIKPKNQYIVCVTYNADHLLLAAIVDENLFKRCPVGIRP